MFATVCWQTVFNIFFVCRLLTCRGRDRPSDNGSPVVQCRALAPRRQMHMNTQPTITLLNAKGDLTITWDKSNEEEILKVIERMMSDGYIFCMIKQRFLGIFGSDRVPTCSIDEVRAAGTVVCSEALKKRLSLDITVSDLASAVDSGVARIVLDNKIKKAESYGSARTAKEVLSSHSVAVRRYSYA
jgi:hypothetical protein